MTADNDIAQRVLQRLQQSSLGLSSRDLARSLKLRATDVNRALLRLQESGTVRRHGTRWQSMASHQGNLGDGGSWQPRSVDSGTDGQPPYSPLASGQRRFGPQPDTGSRARAGETVSPPTFSKVDRRRSRWAVFRQLCEYYAECIRLDQRSTIHSKAEDEFESVVCLDGTMPNARAFHVHTRPSWNLWVRKATTVNYLIVGYPLDRFEWLDPKSGKTVVFISPVFMAPCRFRIDGTTLSMEMVSDARVNEGWLERRLKNLDERRAFLELLGPTNSDESDNTPVSWMWSDCARLLNHYYHDWCTEKLDPRRVGSDPLLSQLARNGLYNRGALIVPRKWRYTSSLYQELIALSRDVPDAELDQSSLRLLFPCEPPARSENTTDPALNEVSVNLVGASPLPLNQEQNLAIEASARESLSVVVGPPGTGKSRIVAAALAQQALRGKNALFASRNHQALEAVVPRVNAMTEPWPLMLRFSRPWGSGADESLRAAIAHLVSSDRNDDGRRLPQLRAALHRRVEERRAAEKLVSDVIELQREIATASFDLEEQIREVPGTYHEHLGKSIQLPTQDQIDRLVAMLRTPTTKWYSLVALFHWLRFKLQWKKTLQLARRMDADFRRAFDSGSTLPPPPQEDSLSVAEFFGKGLTFWRPLAIANRTATKLASLHVESSCLPEIDTVCREVLAASNEAARLAQDCCRALAAHAGTNLSNEERRELAEVLAVMETRSGLDDEADRRQWEKAMRRSFPLFLRHYPLIATTNLSVKRDISLEPGVFDLLVVDEASQCDIASVIPLLFRAKRAMFVGDPMQLSHVTSISSATDRHLRRQFGVASLELERYSFRTTSMFQLANTSDHVGARTALREHHRCHPAIAEYCNESFYRGSWIVLTETGNRPGLRWTDVADDSRPVPGGGAVSEHQIEQVQAELTRLQAEGFEATVGVVTPFRRQADRLRDALFGSLSKSTIERWRLLVDTADGFQGDERDLVLLSLVAGENLTAGSKRFLAGGPNRFNVAVSRARQQLHVFGDAAWARASDIGHIRRLVEACEREEEVTKGYQPDSFRVDLVGPVWEPALASALEEAGLPFFQQYPACGRFLDFALMREGLKLNVEVDGESYHRATDGGRIEADIRRDQALIGAGWTVMRFWVYELRRDMSGCVKRIADRLGVFLEEREAETSSRQEQKEASSPPDASE